jgi:hypothetical protein
MVGGALGWIPVYSKFVQHVATVAETQLLKEETLSIVIRNSVFDVEQGL